MKLSLSCFHVTAVAIHLCETGCLGEHVLLLLSISALWGSHWKRIGLAPAYAFCSNENEKKNKNKKDPEHMKPQKEVTQGSQRYCILREWSDCWSQHSASSCISATHAKCAVLATKGSPSASLVGEKELNRSYWVYA